MDRLWAPWRLQYVTDSAPRTPGCFFCNALEDKGNEAEHLLLYRGRNAFVMMNRYPYNNGHMMVAPHSHVGQIGDVEGEVAAEIWALTAMCKEVAEEVMNVDGINVGINQGKCAGAGVLDHLHVHVVPRWEGDTNFMPVMTDIKIMPQALEKCYEALKPAFDSRV